MIIQCQEEVTDAALAVMERTADPRLREIMVSLVRHLHGFVREVRLTEAEFQAATAILNEMGKLTSDTCSTTCSTTTAPRSRPTGSWRRGSRSSSPS